MTGKGAVTRRELQIAWCLFAVAAAGIDYLAYGLVLGPIISYGFKLAGAWA